MFYFDTKCVSNVVDFLKKHVLVLPTKDAPFQFYDFHFNTLSVSLQSSHLEFDEFHFKFAFQFPFCSIFYAAVGARRNVHNGTICLHFCRGSTNCF